MEQNKFNEIVQNIEGIDKQTASLKKLCKILEVDPIYYKILLNYKTNRLLDKNEELLNSAVLRRELNDIVLENSFNLVKHVLENTIFANGKSKDIFTQWLWLGINSENENISNKYKDLIKDQLSNSLKNGDFEATELILAVKPQENGYYDDTKLLNIFKEVFFLEELPKIFIENLKNGIGKIQHKIELIYCAFFYDIEETKKSKYALNNMDELLEATKMCTNYHHEPRFSLMMNNSFVPGEYSEKMKDTIDYIKNLKAIKNNQFNNTRFISEISNELSGRCGKDKDLLEIVNLFGVDYLSSRDRIKLLSDIFYNLTITNEKFDRYTDNELKPQNDVEKIKLLDCAILYRYRDNEKLQIIQKKFFPHVSYEDMLAKVANEHDPRLFRASYEDFAKRFLTENETIELKNQLENSLTDSTKKTKKMKI